MLLGAAFLAGSLALSTLPALSAETGVSSESTAQFMEISTLLIPHRLDADIGKRMAQAMGALRPSLPSDIAALLSIAKKCNARIVEDFFPDIPEGPLKQTALAIISAWYMGVLVDAPDAEVFAYEQALMYRPTRDVMTIPSYAKSGPNGWNAEAPPLTDMPRF
ncbi:D-sorbitol dehydrogenase-like protein [Paraburkholderia sp. BL6669N2]|nr:D-sorbitol dehydrogenase-like protein [Paraburkholderia sp. BL6669N2]